MKAWDMAGTEGRALMQRVSFTNKDVQYLVERHRAEARFIGRMLRIFGERTVLEALRRYDGLPLPLAAPLFVGICRNVERGQ